MPFSFLSLVGTLAGIIFPRITAVYLFFFSGWFDGVFRNAGWGALGFVFMPRTMLWYSAVVHWWNGDWGAGQYALLAVAILLDLNGGRLGFQRRAYGFM